MYQTGMLLPVKVVPLLTMQGEADCEGKLRQVVTLHDTLVIFSCLSWFLFSSFLLGTFRTCWMHMAWHSLAEAEWVTRPRKALLCKCYDMKTRTWLPSMILDKDTA